MLFVRLVSLLCNSPCPYSLYHRHVTTKPGCIPIYHYNTMIKAHSLNPTSATRAILLYTQIRANPGLSPDTYTFPFVLRAVISLSNLRIGTQIHSQAITIGLYQNVHVSTSLIRMYSQFRGGILDARKVFDEMPLRDVTSWNAMIAGYAKVGDVWNVRELFESMPERNVISWTSVIVGCARADRPAEAIEIFRRMQLTGVNSDEVVIVAVLSACARLGALELGMWVHDFIGKNGLRKTLPLNNALIDMYAKSGNMDKALEVFENMKRRCVVTWTTIISGLAAHGMGREALEMFSRMERAQIKPNEITFVAILSACSHVGLVGEGRWFFKMMEERFGIRPKVEHYGCMVDLLGRHAFLEEAEELVKNMPLKGNAAIWGSLLAASRILGDVALAEKCLQHLIVLEPQNSGNYMLLSNMYASQGRWDESGIMRKAMKDAGVRKAPGASSIEISKRFHEFTSGEKSHPQFEIVDKVLSQIAEEFILSSEMGEDQLMMLAFDAP